MAIIKVETANGLYTVKIPGGAVGATHFAITAKHAASMQHVEGEPMSPAMIERQFEVLIPWSGSVLKHIVLDGPNKYDDIPGEDQYAIFLAVSDAMKVSGDVFRVVE